MSKLSVQEEQKISCLILNRLPFNQKELITLKLLDNSKLDDIFSDLVSNGLINRVQFNDLYFKASIDLEVWRKENIETITFFDDNYPKLLKKLKLPPLVLFYKSQLDEVFIEQEYLSVVGSRNSSFNGERFAFDISYQSALWGIGVISGLAIGIDSASHNGAIKGFQESHIKISADVNTEKISTVAILGCGVDLVYPRSNQKIYDQILENNGILISQFEPKTPPYPSNFLARNYLIAGLSKATVVVEAALKSGALSTARHALEEGRDVLAVPGDIYDKRYEGTNQLIKNGAYLITSFNDVIENVNFDENLFIKETDQDDSNLQSNFEETGLSKDNSKLDLRTEIVKIFRDHSSIQRDMLVRKLINKNKGIDIELTNIEEILLDLVLESRIVENPGFWYSRV